MANEKISGLPENTSPAITDLLATVDDPSGSPVNKKVQIVNLLANLPILYINESANAKMTKGITLNQGASNDEIVALKSSDVGHPMTNIAEANTYGTIKKAASAAGGLQITGLRDPDGAAHSAVDINAYLSEAALTGKVTSTLGVLDISSAITDGGAGVTNVGANGNLITFRNNETTRWILDAEGDIFYGGSDDGTITDAHDDVMLLEGFRAINSPDKSPARTRFEGFLEETESILVEQGVLSAPIAEGGMVSTKGLNGLMIDAMRQMHTRIQELEARLECQKKS